MGEEETTTTTVQSTPEQDALNQALLDFVNATSPGLIEATESGTDLVTQLFGGLLGGDVSGPLGDAIAGISPEVTQDLVDQSLADVAASAQFGGILDSGVSAELAARTSADIRNAAEQFNIGNISNLTSIGLGGVSTLSQPFSTTTSTLADSLATLQGTTTTSPFLTGGDIASAAGSAAAVKGAAACFPEGQCVDVKGGNKNIEDVKAGDVIEFNDGSESTVVMKYEFYDLPSNFIKLKFSNGSIIEPCDKHKIEGKESKEYNVGDIIQGHVIEEKTETTKLVKTYDLITSKGNGDYSVNGITVESMIPELHTAFNAVDGFKKKEKSEVQHG